jgi:ketosteroid isomerase-like protein
MQRIIFMLALTVVACLPATVELTEEQRSAIADEIAARYAAAAEAIRATDVDQWLTFYANSEDLAFTSCIENGTVAMYRSWAARRDTTYAHYAGVSTMDRFEWGDLHTRVLAPNVALVATTYHAEATDTAGAPFAGDATWVALWVKEDGEWKMMSVAETWSQPDTPSGAS